MKKRGNKNLLRIRNLKKKFSDNEVLKGIDCDIEEGQVVGIIGPNGSGKTTLIRILATLLRPTGGKFWIDGISPDKDLEKMRRAIGYCPDRLPVDGKLTGHEFLEFFARLYKKELKRVDELASLVDLEEAMDRPIKKYSKGMQKRLSIARVLLIDPKVFLLDEPTSGLDPTGQRLIQDVLISMEKKGRLVILSSHNLYEVERVCDKIFFLQDGRFTTLDSISDAFKGKGLTIIDITLKRVEDKLVHSILREFKDLTFLSSTDTKLRFTTKGGIEKGKVLNFIQEKKGEVIEIKYL